MRNAPEAGETASARSAARSRLTAVLVVAALAYVVAVAIVLWAFGIAEIGYRFFELSDIPHYFEYARSAAAGLRPYVDFGVEFPPLAMTLLTSAGGANGLADYAYRFAALMLLLGAAAAVVTASAAARLWPTGRSPYVAGCAFALGVVATGALLANRFDVAVALVVATVLLLLARGSPVAAAAVLGLGFALKLVPAALLPLVLVLSGTPRRALGTATAFVTAAALPFLPFLPGGPSGLLGVLAYHRARPLQVESVLATPLWIGHLLGLTPVSVVSSFGSENLGGEAASWMASLSAPLGLAALAAVYAAIWRGRVRLRSERALLPVAVATVLLAVVTFGKVLSPQYLIWLLPCVALVLTTEPLLGGTIVTAIALSQLEFPANYFRFVGLDPRVIALVVVRNGMVALAFALALRRLWRLAASP
jgi:hypothetical protein